MTRNEPKMVQKWNQIKTNSRMSYFLPSNVKRRFKSQKKWQKGLRQTSFICRRGANKFLFSGGAPINNLLQLNIWFGKGCIFVWKDLNACSVMPLIMTSWSQLLMFFSINNICKQSFMYTYSVVKISWSNCLLLYIKWAIHVTRL